MADPRILFSVAGAAAATLALLTGHADRRRMRRSNPDAIGWMPWRGISIGATFVALIMLAVAAVLWMRD